MIFLSAPVPFRTLLQKGQRIDSSCFFKISGVFSFCNSPNRFASRTRLKNVPSASRLDERIPDFTALPLDRQSVAEFFNHLRAIVDVLGLSFGGGGHLHQNMDIGLALFDRMRRLQNSSESGILQVPLPSGEIRLLDTEAAVKEVAW